MKNWRNLKWDINFFSKQKRGFFQIDQQTYFIEPLNTQNNQTTNKTKLPHLIWPKEKCFWPSKEKLVAYRTSSPCTKLQVLECHPLFEILLIPHVSHNFLDYIFVMLLREKFRKVSVTITWAIKYMNTSNNCYVTNVIKNWINNVARKSQMLWMTSTVIFST